MTSATEMEMPCLENDFTSVESTNLYSVSEYEMETEAFADSISTETSSNHEHNIPTQILQIEKRTHSTKRRKWLILLSGYFFIFLANGFPFQLSVMYVEFLDEFQVSKAEISLILSVCTGVFYGSGLLSGLLVSRVGVKKSGIIGGLLISASLSLSYLATSPVFLVISIGVASGFGFSIIYINSSACVAPYFEGKSRAVAMMSLSFASGAGWLAFPYIFQYLIDEYNWRGTLLIIGGFCLNCIPASIVFKLSDKERKNKITTNSKTSLKRKTYLLFEIVKTIKEEFRIPEFWIFSIGLASSLSALNTIKMFLIDFYMTKDLSRTDSVMIFFIMNLAGTLSRIIPLLMKYVSHTSVLCISAIMSLIGCAAVAILVTLDNISEIIVTSSFLGSSLGCILTVFPFTIHKLVGPSSFAKGIGVAMTITGVGMTIAGPFSGYLQDKSGSFQLSFFSASGALLCSSILFVAARTARKKGVHERGANAEVVIETNKARIHKLNI